MSMFENAQYQWRETYFVLFPSERRPKLKDVQKAITKLHQHLTLTNLAAMKRVSSSRSPSSPRTTSPPSISHFFRAMKFASRWQSWPKTSSRAAAVRTR